MFRRIVVLTIIQLLAYGRRGAPGLFRFTKDGSSEVDQAQVGPEEGVRLSACLLSFLEARLSCYAL